MNTLWTFVLLWGVWLITPIVFDGLESLFRLAMVSWGRRRDPKGEVDDFDLPTVAVVVPAHNEEAVIDRCINSIKAQDYPHDKLEVIVVDDGSTDDTASRVEEHVNGNGTAEFYEETPATNASFILGGRAIKVGEFKGEMTLIKNGHQGKAHALNAGIQASDSEILVNIDSDVVLAEDSIRAIAMAFLRDPDLGAITGNIEVDWDTIEDRDRNGELILDENGDIQPKKLRIGERYLAKSQFLEYLSSFRLGRESQSRMGTIYTLAGACSGFRREVLEEGLLYSNRTVSEDTDLTLDLHRADVKVAFVPGARVYLEPVIDWDSLYAQRVRWTRGQLEVCALNKDIIGKRKGGLLGRFTLPQMLLFDHTLAFPRLVWAILILFFPMLGYSWATILQALIAMYLLYVFVEVVNALSCYSVSEDDTRRRIEKSGWELLLLPVFRFVVFHFRFSGFLVTLKEEQAWTMPGPMSQTKNDVRLLRLRSIEFATGFVTVAGVALIRVVRYAQAVLVPAIMGIVLALAEIISTNRKAG